MLPTNEQVKRELISQIRDGKYTMGELIVPCIFKKCYVSNNGILCWKEFAVEGRKIALVPYLESYYKTVKTFIA